MNGNNLNQSGARAPLLQEPQKNMWLWVVLIVVVVVAFVALLYYIYTPEEESAPSLVLPQRELSDDVTVIEEDLGSTGFTDLGSELGDIEKELVQ